MRFKESFSLSVTNAFVYIPIFYVLIKTNHWLKKKGRQTILGRFCIIVLFLETTKKHTEARNRSIYLIYLSIID
jgi:hypothetical protein